MTNRERDGRRPSRAAQQPSWDEWASDEFGEADSSARVDAETVQDLPSWSDADQEARRRLSSRRAPTTSGGDSRSRGRLPELSRSLRGGRADQADQYRPPEREIPEREAVANWQDESEQWTDDEASAQMRSSRAESGYRASTGRGAQRARASRSPRVRQSRTAPTITLPPALANASIFQDRLLLGLLGFTLISLALMAAVVGNRLGQMPPAVVLHLNAAGVPDLWGTRSTLWRLPLAAAMLGLMNVVAAAFLLDRNAFVGRFLVASSILVNVLAWIGVVLIFW